MHGSTNLNEARHETQFHTVFLLELILVLRTELHQVRPFMMRQRIKK